MAVNFSESKTKENLMRAFAGERSWHMHGDFTNC